MKNSPDPSIHLKGPTGSPDHHRGLHKHRIRGCGPCCCISLFINRLPNLPGVPSLDFLAPMLGISILAYFPVMGGSSPLSVYRIQRMIYECRCDERLRAKAEGSTRLAYTGWRGGRTPKDKRERERERLRLLRYFVFFMILRVVFTRIFKKRVLQKNICAEHASTPRFQTHSRRQTEAHCST